MKFEHEARCYELFFDRNFSVIDVLWVFEECRTGIVFCNRIAAL